jgi:hypothetical protein
MTATVQTPKHPLGQMTTYELRDYRRELEEAMTDVAPDSPAHASLRQSLDEVLAEQEARQRIRDAR